MTTLERVIRLPHATAMVAGTIIGASIFVQPSEISAKVPSLAGVSLVWLVCGVLTLFGALVTAELASTFPRSGASTCTCVRLTRRSWAFSGAGRCFSPCTRASSP